MDLLRRALILTPLILSCTLATGAAQTALAPQRVSLTAEQMEVFLRKAKVIAKKKSEKGVTDTVVATLSDGSVTHAAQIQIVNVSKAFYQVGKVTEVGFRDTYKFNIAGYRLAQLLGLQTVPMSVERRIDGKDAALTWWVDDVKMDEDGRIKLKAPAMDVERVSKQMHVMHVWDELIQNSDRNRGNILWTSDWTLWLIDHTRAFRRGDQLLKPDQLTRCDRVFLDAMRRLTPEHMAQVARGGILTKEEAAAVLKRRDRLVKHFDDLVAERGEASVLFTLGS